MCLLAVDLGMKAGLAWFGEDGRLLRCRTVHFPNRTVLKKAMPAILDELPLDFAVIEGGGPVAALWWKAVVKRDLPIIQTCAEAWREDILWLRERHRRPPGQDLCGGVAGGHPLAARTPQRPAGEGARPAARHESPPMVQCHARVAACRRRGGSRPLRPLGRTEVRHHRGVPK